MDRSVSFESESTIVRLPHGTWTHRMRMENLNPDLITTTPVGVPITSVIFRACGHEYFLTVYLGGRSVAEAGHISVHLTAMAGQTVEKKMELSLVCGSKRLTSTRVFNDAFVPKFLAHSDILASPASFLRDGILEVVLSLTEPGFTFSPAVAFRAPGADSVQIDVPAPTLAAELKSALASHARADIALLCGGETFEAHSFMLSLRSSVFAAQLDPGSPLAAPDRSKVPVPDSVTPSTLLRLLEFVYCDDLEPSSAEEAQHLLNAADYYALPRLRAICERALCARLSVENAAFTLTLAEQHGAADLKRAALRFIARNAAAVTTTEGWAHLAVSKPQLKDEVILALAEPSARVPLAAGRRTERSAHWAAGPRMAQRRRIFNNPPPIVPPALPDN